jgi:hypothetical protein
VLVEVATERGAVDMASLEELDDIGLVAHGQAEELRADDDLGWGDGDAVGDEGVVEGAVQEIAGYVDGDRTSRFPPKKPPGTTWPWA